MALDFKRLWQTKILINESYEGQDFLYHFFAREFCM